MRARLVAAFALLPCIYVYPALDQCEKVVDRIFVMFHGAGTPDPVEADRGMVNLANMLMR
jgi:hypothetical protein